MGTKNNPGAFDCYDAAEPDEPMFTVLARDADAPTLVRDWAQKRQQRISRGQAPASDQVKVDEADECAMEMERWREVNRR